jgi:ATP synthase protein I
LFSKAGLTFQAKLAKIRGKIMAEEKKPRRFNYRRLAELSSLGLMLPSSIAVGLTIGFLLDKVFGTWPWLLAIFTLLGVFSGFLGLLRGLKKVGIEEDKENDDG